MFHASTGQHDGSLKSKLHPTKKILLFVVMIISLVISMTSCGKTAADTEDPNAPDRDNKPVVLKTKAPGDEEFSGPGCAVDYSNAKKGYIMAKYSGSNNKVKLELSSGDASYFYDLSTGGDWEAFPISEGNGDYSVGIHEHVSGEQYTPALEESFSVKLKDEFEPFLHPNQYVDFTKKTQAVIVSEEVCSGAKSDLGAVEKMFDYVTKNIEYDYDKAVQVESGYLPNIDETLQTGKGICFDYASVMTAMLRAQRIPCKLVIGYAGSAYHAWISVYLEDHGWVDNMIEFKGDKWTIMDPTFASSGDESDPNLVGDGSNYNPNYYY